MIASLPAVLPAERLALLYHLSQTFNSSLEMDDVLVTLIDEMIAATRAERGFVLLKGDEGQLVFQTARDNQRTDIPTPEMEISCGVIDQVMADGKAVLTQDAQVDSRFSGLQSVAFLGITSIICAPLKAREIPLGVVYIESRMKAGLFKEADLELVNAISSTAAIAIDNARLYRMAVEKARLERELQVAREVQKTFLPESIFQPHGWEIHPFMEPAREVGGDFYDVFPLGYQRRIGIVMADVVDKGVGAAMFMALFRSLIRAFTEQNFSAEMNRSHQAALQAVIKQTNDYIARTHGSTSMFATVFIGILDPQSGELLYVNGGHEPPILLGVSGAPGNGRSGNAMVRATLGPTGPAVGLFAGAEFSVQTERLAPGETLLAFSDGVLDALNPQGEAFGQERLEALVQSCNCPAVELVERVRAGLEEYIQARAQYDDITLLAIKRS